MLFLIKTIQFMQVTRILKYQDILQAYHIIDQADSLVLLQKKTIANDVLQQLKKKYELDIE